MILCDRLEAGIGAVSNDCGRLCESLIREALEPSVGVTELAL